MEKEKFMVNYIKEKFMYCLLTYLQIVTIYLQLFFITTDLRSLLFTKKLIKINNK